MNFKKKILCKWINNKEIYPRYKIESSKENCENEKNKLLISIEHTHSLELIK